MENLVLFMHEIHGTFYVYPKAFGEEMLLETPLYYSYLVVSDGEVVKDRWDLFGLYHKL